MVDLSTYQAENMLRGAKLQSDQETQKDQQMNSLFKAVTPSPGSGGLFTEYDLEEKKMPMDQKWRLVEVLLLQMG